ncbi:hypothetical protein [Streptomyces sp. N50]|uniref:hypothetical protein n=1 Tax=Streptomyces sp. N50 TaxID=3081765 RepID=UPI00398CC3C0
MYGRRDGKQVWDVEGLTPAPAPDAAHGDVLDFLRKVTDVRWTSFRPAGTIAPGDAPASTARARTT